ncbi:hypothetical protein [Actimicrobium antarcticum]|uniref:Uncharacterized protein n=1 Tax=Actimicrobium antarcticum TaxID=1051899 RepID=A0ABP7TSE8_9BURK
MDTLDRFFKRLGFLVNLAGLVCLVMIGLYTLYRIPFHWRRRRDATSEAERNYFECKLYACCLGGYAFVVSLMLLLAGDWFATYWPAICANWTDHGAIGQVGHHDAVAGDAGLALVGCALLYWVASTMGKTLIDCDGEEMFFPN